MSEYIKTRTWSAIVAYCYELRRKIKSDPTYPNGDEILRGLDKKNILKFRGMIEPYRKKKRGTKCQVHDKFLEAIEKFDNWKDV